LTGCSSKKKVAVQPKQTVKVPETKPAIVPQIEELIIEEKEESIVPRDLRFATIYFDFDKSNIRDDQRSSIINNAQLLSRYQMVKIMVEADIERWSSYLKGKIFPWDALNYPGDIKLLNRHMKKPVKR